MSARSERYADLAGFRDHGHVLHLDVDGCLDRLRDGAMGRVAMNDPAGPVVLPVTYVVDGGTVLFRTTLGSKLTAAEEREPASFQVDHLDPDRGRAWSVLVRGRLEEVTDPDELDRLRALGLHPLAGGTREHFVRVLAASMTGRKVAVPAPADGDPAGAPVEHD